MLYTEEEMVQRATPITQRAVDSVANQERAARLLRERQATQRSAHVSEKREDAGNTDESTKNMFRMFGSWMQSFGNTVKDTLDITKAWKGKPDCKN